MVFSYVASGNAAAALLSLMRFVREDRRVSMPRALIAEDTGLTERQVKDAIRSLKRTTVPDPETGEGVPLLEVTADGHNGAATEYRLNVSNVDRVPFGYELAKHGGVGVEPAAPTGARVGEGVAPTAEGVAPAAEGVAPAASRGGACHPLIDKEINKKIKGAGKGERGEWDGKPYFRAECPECGGLHAFVLRGREFGAAVCPNTGKEQTAPPPDGYRVIDGVGGHVLEWLGDGRA